MRKADLTADTVFEAEKAADDRRQNRAGGFKLMKDRDRGWAQLTPRYHSASSAYMTWGKDDSSLFTLEIQPYGGKTVEVILDGEEVRKWLRWV